MTFTPIQIIGILINLLGIFVGVIAVWTVTIQSQSFGGKMGSAVSVFIWGVVFQVVAFFYTIGHDYLGLKDILDVGGINIHHALMGIGMIFFMVSARRFMMIGRG